MRLNEDGGVELTPPEQDAFEKFRDALCSDAQEVLGKKPEHHDIFDIIFPHMGSCRQCAAAVSDYFDGKANGDDA